MHPFVYIKQVVVTSMRYTLLGNIRSMLYILLLGLGFSQEITTEYLVENGDTIDVFSYQIPENYDFLNSHALLVAFHQWGGDENSNYYRTNI